MLSKIKWHPLLKKQTNSENPYAAGATCSEEVGRSTTGLGLGENQAWGNGIILETWSNLKAGFWEFSAGLHQQGFWEQPKWLQGRSIKDREGLRGPLQGPRSTHPMFWAERRQDNFNPELQPRSHCSRQATRWESQVVSWSPSKKSHHNIWVLLCWPSLLDKSTVFLWRCEQPFWVGMEAEAARTGLSWMDFYVVFMVPNGRGWWLGFDVQSCRMNKKEGILFPLLPLFWRVKVASKHVKYAFGWIGLCILL